MNHRRFMANPTIMENKGKKENSPTKDSVWLELLKILIFVCNPCWEFRNPSPESERLRKITFDLCEWSWTFEGTRGSCETILGQDEREAMETSGKRYQKQWEKSLA
jgi:hypothetical protein